MAPEVSAEAVAFGSLLAQIRGHHGVSLELYQAGDREAAAAHAGHPITELLDAVRRELDEHGGDAAALEQALKAGAGIIVDRGTPDELRAAYEQVATLTGTAEAAAVGDAAASPAYRGSVIAALLATAAHEYEEAAAEGAIRELVEYQDAYGFAKEARRLYEGLAPDVRAAAAKEADEIEEALEALGVALPGPTPPATVASVDEVERAAGLVGHELEEAVGARPVKETDPAAEVTAIEGLLDQILAAYQAGRADEASELAAEAYLEHYEVIEADVIAKAPAVNEELEPLLGAELRKRITEGAPAAEIEQMIVRAKELLSAALEALEGS